MSQTHPTDEKFRHRRRFTMQKYKNFLILTTNYFNNTSHTLSLLVLEALKLIELDIIENKPFSTILP